MHYNSWKSNGFLMQQNNLKQKDLIGIIGGKSAVYEILNGKRPLNLNHIRKLAEKLSRADPISSWAFSIQYLIMGSLLTAPEPIPNDFFVNGKLSEYALVPFLRGNKQGTEDHVVFHTHIEQ